MSDKWTLYHQTGPDGQEWGVRVRRGYVVVGFSREDAEAVVAWQNAAVSRPADDILERAKALRESAFGTHAQALDMIGELEAEIERWKKIANRQARRSTGYRLAAKRHRAEVERLRSVAEARLQLNWTLSGECNELKQEIATKNARIKELEAENQQLIAFCKDYLSANERRLKDLIILDGQIERLEAAFLEAETERKFYATINGMNSDFDWKSYPEKPQNGIHKEWFREQAREALERIRSGEKDE